jgi:type II secretion system protein C
MRLIGRLNKVLRGLNLVLLAVALCVAVTLLMRGRPERDAAVATSSVGTAKAPDDVGQKAQGNVDPRLILERNIFGAGSEAVLGGPGKSGAGASGRPTPDIKRGLSLRLLGTVIDEKGASYAILEDLGTKAQDIYRIGDVIGETRIDSIEQNRIVVVNRGVREMLSIALTAREVPTEAAVSPTPALEPVEVGAGEIVRVVSDSQRQINLSASRESAGYAAQFLSKLRLSPHTTSGKSDGLRLSGLGDSAIAQLVGLRDGDVIEAVNGHAVPDQRKAIQVLRKARNLGSAQIDFVRGRERKSVAFHAGSW